MQTKEEILAVAAGTETLAAPAAAMVALTPAQAEAMSTHFQVPTANVEGYVVPQTERAMRAGSVAVANVLTLQLQNGKITQQQFDEAIAALTPPAPPAHPLTPGGKGDAAAMRAEQVMSVDQSTTRLNAEEDPYGAFPETLQAVDYSLDGSVGVVLRTPAATETPNPFKASGGELVAALPPPPSLLYAITSGPAPDNTGIVPPHLLPPPLATVPTLPVLIAAIQPAPVPTKNAPPEILDYSVPPVNPLPLQPVTTYGTTAKRQTALDQE